MPDLEEVLEGGELRRLGTLQPLTAKPDTLSDVFGDTAAANLIPRSQWRPVSYRWAFPKRKNQSSIGMCNASATGNITEGCRALAGLPAVALSGGDLYRRICGGRDQGSLPEDALKELMSNGMAPESAIPYLDWRNNNATADAERPKYRITEALWCPTFDHVASALIQGFLIDVAVWWWGNDPIDGDGWLRVSGSGGKGGHAICGCELAERNGQWGVGINNSWGSGWGQDGFGILPEARINQGCQVFSVWACRATLQEGGNFPAPIGP